MRAMRSFSVVMSAAALAFAFQAFCQTPEPAKPAHSGNAMGMKSMPAIPATAGALLDDIAAQLDNVDTMIKTNKLTMVHEHAEIIGNNCKELMTVGLPADSAKRGKVEGYLKNMEKIAVKLDEYGDANNAGAVGTELKKARALYDLLIKQYPQTTRRMGARSQSSDSSMRAMDTKGMKMVSDTSSKVSESGYWTCPMHPEVHKTVSGQCPICGMNLVYKGSNKKDMDRIKM